MKSFILKLLCFSFLFFLFDKLFLPVLYYNPQTQIDRRLEFILKGEINKDLIVMGSSRGARNIIAGQLERETGLSAYNLSFPGSDIEYHEFILRSLLKFNKPPKVILLAVDDPLELSASDLIKFRYESLYPFMRYDHIVQEMVNRKEKNKLLAELLVLYRMNKSNFDLRQKHVTAYDTMMTCGSMPVSFNSEKDFEFDAAGSGYNKQDDVPEKVMAFQKLVTLCAENHIKLIVLFPPNFKNHDIVFENRIRLLLHGDTCTYVYNSNNPVYRDKNCYYDADHLMVECSKILTHETASFIRTLDIKITPGQRAGDKK